MDSRLLLGVFLCCAAFVVDGVSMDLLLDCFFVL